MGAPLMQCLSGIILLAAALSAPAKTLVVCPATATAAGCDFSGGDGIQLAVDGATSGDSILIRAGRYAAAAYREVAYKDFTVRAFVVIDGKGVSIVGEPGTVFDGSVGPPTTAIVVHRGDLSISNLTLTGFRYGVKEDDFYEGHGLFVIHGRARVDNVTIEKFQKMGLTGRGDSLLDVSNLRVLDGHVGIWLHESAYLRLRDSIIRGNDSAGIAAYDNSVAHVLSSVFDGNLDDGLYSEQRAVIFATNSLILRNKPIGAHASGESRIWLGYSALFGNASNVGSKEKGEIRLGAGVIDSDPRLGPDYRLLPDSPLIGKGDPDVGESGASRSDIGLYDTSTHVTPQSTFRDCPRCPEMTVIPAGAFDMGSASDEVGRSDDEGPRHRVEIPGNVAIGVFEVTRREFAAFAAATAHVMGNDCQSYESGSWQSKKGATWRDPGFPQSDRDPVVCVSWNDARAYARWLSGTTGRSYRLLSEAEWEYVARTGSVGRPGLGDVISHDLANYGADTCCGPKKEGKDQWDYTAPVGSFSGDALGLHDIRGNVWEWLEDCYNHDYVGAPTDGSARTDNCSHADRRSLRGGSWGDGPQLLRLAYRLRGPSGGRYVTLGFRVAMNLN